MCKSLDYQSKNRSEYARLVRHPLEAHFTQNAHQFIDGVQIDLSSTFALFAEWEKAANVHVSSDFYSSVVTTAVNAFLDAHNLSLLQYSLSMENSNMTIQAQYHISKR